MSSVVKRTTRPAFSAKTGLKTGLKTDEPLSCAGGCGNFGCCNDLLSAYGKALQESAAITVNHIKEASALQLATMGAAYGNTLKPRIQAIRFWYLLVKDLVEAYVRFAAECNTKCCKGLSKGMLGSVVGIANITIAQALNPLFVKPAEILEGLQLGFEELKESLILLLDVAGCACFVCPEFVAPEFEWP